MDAKTAKKFRERAMLVSHSLGFGEHAEDFAQDVLVKFCEGRGKSQTVQQAVIDVIRSKYGRPSMPGHRQKLALQNAFSIFGEEGELAFDFPQPDQTEGRESFDHLLSLLPDRNARDILTSHYWGGDRLHEIGKKRGVSESRMSQLMAVAEGQLKSRVLSHADSLGLELESRSCGCGCGVVFKCLPGSKQKYASGGCQESATGSKVTFTPAKRRHVELKEERSKMENGKQLVSAAELARQVGVSTVTIYNWKKAGLITPDADGFYDIEEAKAAAAETRGARRQARLEREGLEPNSLAPSGSAAEADEENGEVVDAEAEETEEEESEAEPAPVKKIKPRAARAATPPKLLRRKYTRRTKRTIAWRPVLMSGSIAAASFGAGVLFHVFMRG